MVYVVNRHGKPLMPTKRYGKVRKLLKNGLAVPISNMPFIIKLKYDVTDYTQDLWLGIDPGRENIGFGVSREDGECVFLSGLHTNNKSVKKNMDNRRMRRQQRKHHHRLSKQRRALRDNDSFGESKDDLLKNRKPCKSKDISYPKMEKHVTCKAIRGAEAQFANRKKRCGLTPSARQLLQMHLLSVQKIMGFLPINHIIMERNYFDFQKMEHQDIRAWQYSKGILYGYKDYKEYIREQQGGKCLLCGCNRIDNYHHIKSLSKGGSDTPANIAGLCDSCHNRSGGVHKDLEAAERLSEKKSGLKQKYKVSLLNTVMPYLVDEINKLCEKYDISFSMTDGYDTFQTRKKHGFPKEHYIDGYTISLAGRETNCVGLQGYVYIQQRFKKKSAANIQKLNSREYYAIKGNKEILVTRNRHKAEGQTCDSLEEYMEGYAINHSERECTEHLRSLTVKPAKRIYLAHKYGMWSDIHTGDVIKYEKHNKIKGNTKREVFVATGIEILDEKIRFHSKNRKMKFCRKLTSSCIPYISKVPIFILAPCFFVYFIFLT